MNEEYEASFLFIDAFDHYHTVHRENFNYVSLAKLFELFGDYNTALELLESYQCFLKTHGKRSKRIDATLIKIKGMIG